MKEKYNKTNYNHNEKKNFERKKMNQFRKE